VKYLPVLLLLAVSACAEHHDLTQCKGPYLALSPPPPPPIAEAPKAAPIAIPAPLKPAQQQVTANAPNMINRGVK
jgi:hypothetical protein